MSAEFAMAKSASRSAKRSGTKEAPIAEASKPFSTLFCQLIRHGRGFHCAAELVKFVVSIAVIVANAVSKNESEPWTFSK